MVNTVETNTIAECKYIVSTWNSGEIASFVAVRVRIESVRLPGEKLLPKGLCPRCGCLD